MGVPSGGSPRRPPRPEASSCRSTRTACRCTATCSAPRSTFVRVEPGAPASPRSTTARTPTSCARFRSRTSLTVDARARRRARPQHSHRGRADERRGRCRSRSAGTRTCGSRRGRRASGSCAGPRANTSRSTSALIPTGARTRATARSAHRSARARSTTTTRSGRTARSRSRPRAATLDAGVRSPRIRSRSCSCRARGQFVAIEPMTAEIDALGRGTAPVVRSRATAFAATLHDSRADAASGSVAVMPGALDGVRILDLSWGIAGPLGVLLLAEQGADVIKVEPPGGDPFRAYDGYRVWNRSRRSLDRRPQVRPRASDVFERLLATADVVVESFRPGVMERLGFGFDDGARARTRASSTSRAPRIPTATGSRNARATTRSCRRAAARCGNSRAGAWVRSSCTCRCRRWARSSSISHRRAHRADRARSDRPRATRRRRRCSRARCSTRRRSGSTSRSRPRSSTS